MLSKNNSKNKAHWLVFCGPSLHETEENTVELKLENVQNYAVRIHYKNILELIDSKISEREIIAIMT